MTVAVGDNETPQTQSTEVCLSSTATPHPGGFKCFTCQDAADNYECNRWAPDVYCPKGISAFSLLQCEHFWDINTISLCGVEILK